MSGDIESLTQSAQRWLGLAALFVAPTSLLTGLCYFFGLAYLRSRLDYFGIDPSTLELTTTDYVVAVVKAFFFAALRALAVIAVALLLVVALHHWAATGKRIKLLRLSARVVLSVAVLCLANGLCWLASERLPIAWVLHGASAPYTAWSIVLGVALIVTGYWMLVISNGSGSIAKRLPRPAERTLIVIAASAIVTALFWITDIYATDLGKKDAAYDAQNLWVKDESVQLDTTEVLTPPSRLVKTSRLPSDGGPAAPTYRYECLHVIEVRNGHYILLPAKWTRETGWALSLTPDSTHRINGVVHQRLADLTGNGNNVRTFWQCPEVVRSYTEVELERMLVSPDVVGAVLGAKALTAGPADRSMPALLDLSAAPQANACAAQDGTSGRASSLPAYPDGVTTRRAEVAGDGASGPLWAVQRVTRFPSPATAEEFFQATQRRWLQCANKVVMVDRKGTVQPRTLSAPGSQEDILAVADSAVGETDADCAQAISAKSNVVIQVDVCGAQQPVLAAGVVAAIREGMPVE